MLKLPKVLAGPVIVATCFGCAWLWGPWPVYPVTTGYHSRAPQCWAGPQGPVTYAVWAQHAGVGQYITGALLQKGHRVVERAHLEQIFNEQKFRLMYTPEREADLLHIGQMAGATHMIFADVSTSPRDIIAEERGYALSVSVRSVNVETGEVCWSGTASTPDRIMSPVDSSAISGAYWAMARALCLVEAGYRWIEPSASNKGGCEGPSTEGGTGGTSASHTQRIMEQPVWRELHAQELAKEAERLNAAKQAFDQEKVGLEQTKAALDREYAALQRLMEYGAPQGAIVEYQRRLAEFNRRLADYNRRVAEHNRRIADYQQRTTAFQQSR